MATDHFKILPAPVAATLESTHVEPEEAPTQRVLELPMDMSIGAGPGDQSARLLKRGLTPVTSDFMAGEVAKAVASRCATCVHFRNDLWRLTMKNWAESNIGRRKILDRFIANLARAVNPGLPSLKDLAEAEIQLRHFGVCSALTDSKSDLTIVHPEGGCPEGFDAYQHRDKAAKLEASANFDSIMRAAQGKT